MSTSAWEAARASAAAVRGGAAGIVAMPPEPCTALPGPLQGCSAAGCVRAKRGNALARPAARPFGQPRIRLHGGAQGPEFRPWPPAGNCRWSHEPAGPWRRASKRGGSPPEDGRRTGGPACHPPSSQHRQALQLSVPCQLTLCHKKKRASNTRGPAAARLCQRTTTRLSPGPLALTPTPSHQAGEAFTWGRRHTSRSRVT